ncbi:50S ribosomal protein L10 [archaeon]|nr:50S ribosomal protein L10 [archaeon]
MEMVSEKKKKMLVNIEKELADAKVIGMINMHKLPARQLQRMKKDLTGKAKIIMARKSILLLALRKVSTSKENLDKIIDNITAVPAIMVSDENPFKLYQYLKKNKSPAAAKTGDTAPEDITVNKGPTSMQPGPAMTQLQSVGLKTGVEGGNISIMEDYVVAKSGDEITGDMAAVFNMLGLEPMKIGIDLTMVWEDGTVYGKDVLDIDEDEFYSDVLSAVQAGINLSLNAGYITNDNASLAIQKAFAEARVLAIEANVLTPDVIGSVLAKAAAEMKELTDKVGDLEPKAEEPKPEEKEEPKEDKKDDTSKEEKSKEE